MRLLVLLMSISIFPLTAVAGTFLAQLKVGAQHVCVLGDNPSGVRELRCWDFEGKPLPVPPLRDPQMLASTAKTVCAIADKRIRCWSYGEDAGRFASLVGRGFASLKDPVQLVGGKAVYCAIDREVGIRCVGPETKDEDCSGTSLTAGGAAIKAPQRMWANGCSACALDGEGKIHCWSAPPSPNRSDIVFRDGASSYYIDKWKKLNDEVPSAPGIVTDISLSYVAQACAQTLRGVVCWGSAGSKSHPDFRPFGIGASAWHERGLISATEQGVIRNDEGKLSPEEGFEGFAGALLVSAGFGPRCAANATDLRCLFSQGGPDFEIPHGLALRVGPETQLVSQFLESLLPVLYQEKRDFVKRLAQLNETNGGDEARFLLASLEPLITLTDSEQVKTHFVPYYQSLKDGLRLPGDLKSFPKTAASEMLTLKLLQAGLPGVGSAMGADPNWPDFCRVLGEAISGKAGALRDLKVEIDRVRPSVSRAVESPRARPLAVIWLALTLFLE